MPTISVVIPAYNATKYIIEALKSIENQTVKPNEVVIVDDGSIDDTVAVVTDYIKRSALTIRIIQSSQNRGIGVSRQKGAESVKSEYVAYLSSDDCYHPNFIEYSIPYLNSNTATYTAYYRCDENLVVQSIFNPPEFSVASTVEWALKKNMYVNFSSVIIPKSIFSKVFFEGSLRHGEDLIFLLDTVAAKTRWHLIEEPLVYYRVHSLAGSFTQRPEEFELLWRYLKTRLVNFSVPKKQIQRAYVTSHNRAYPNCFRQFLSRIYYVIKKVFRARLFECLNFV